MAEVHKNANLASIINFLRFELVFVAVKLDSVLSGCTTLVVFLLRNLCGSLPAM